MLLPVARDVRQDHQGGNETSGSWPLVVARLVEQVAVDLLPVIGGEAA
jgi:hypothetical protein